MPFDPTMVFGYTVDQALQFIRNNEVTKEQLYSLGFPAGKRPALEQQLEEIERLPIEDEEMWQWASSRHTMDAYRQYLKKYDTHDPGLYRGNYVFDAKSYLEDLEREAVELRQNLFFEMREHPWKFKAEEIYSLVKGVTDQQLLNALRHQDDIASKFIVSGQKITFDDLLAQEVVPPHFSLGLLMENDYTLPQTNLKDLGEFPVCGRTDVFIFGVPRGGKSSVVAGMFHEMYKSGRIEYEPQLNENGIDNCRAYYEGLIKSVERSKFPVSTARDVMTFMKITLNSNSRSNPLTVLEIGGEAFKDIAKAHVNGPDVWTSLGAARCLQSQNRKFLAFVVDYSNMKNARNDAYDDLEQAMILESSLSVMKSDGSGRNPRNNCTLSKVDTVVVIVTKCDLMGDGLGADEKSSLARQFLKDKFATFMSNLTMACKEFGINAVEGYSPYVMPFSLGKLCVGNSYVYDPSDSRKLINLIASATTSTSNRTSLFNIFGTRTR